MCIILTLNVGGGRGRDKDNFHVDVSVCITRTTFLNPGIELLPIKKCTLHGPFFFGIGLTFIQMKMSQMEEDSLQISEPFQGAQKTNFPVTMMS